MSNQPELTIDRSDEALAALPTGVEICYRTYGSPDADPLLMVMGLGGPMIWWDPVMLDMLADRGFYVIAFDNRDTGRSSKLKQHPVGRKDLIRAFLGGRSTAPYSLADMAADGFALLDHLGVAAAHVCGVSMGGMIVQSMAIADQRRVRSLTSIMSTTGRRTVGWQDPRLAPGMIRRGARSEEQYVDGSAAFWELISSPGYPTAPGAAETRARDTYRRGVSMSGVMRQMLAILTQPDRTPALRNVAVPAAVVHGLADRMVHVSGGRATAQAIPGAELMLVPGMGHDLPPGLFDTFVDTIRRTADRA